MKVTTERLTSSTTSLHWDKRDLLWDEPWIIHSLQLQKFPLPLTPDIGLLLIDFGGPALPWAQRGQFGLVRPPGYIKTVTHGYTFSGRNCRGRQQRLLRGLALLTDIEL